jgi:uncharacterized protein with HEPN domain
MLDAAREAADFLGRHTRADLDGEPFLWRGLVNCIENIGETATKVTVERRSRYREVDWPKITGIRHKLVHNYDEIDYDVVWDTATEDLPALIPVLERMLAEL